MINHLMMTEHYLKDQFMRHDMYCWVRLGLFGGGVGNRGDRFNNKKRVCPENERQGGGGGRGG